MKSRCNRDEAIRICLLSPCGIHPEGFFLKERIKVRGITIKIKIHPHLASPVEGEEFYNGLLR